MHRLESIDLDDFPRLTGQWMRGGGQDADVVVSTRVRLARNLAESRFPTRMSDDDRRVLVERVAACFGPSTLMADLQAVTPIERLLLVERHLISRELALGDGARAVIFGHSESISVMVNEEDHLRIQAIRPGFEPARAWRALRRIELMLEKHLPFACHERYGFLTACPTNVGTGMRFGVMLHLPALTLKDLLPKVQQSADAMSLSLRGLYGEGSKASGDFYQLSNQRTLGQTEEDIMDEISKLVPTLINYERKTRQTLLDHDLSFVEDKVQRSLGTLRSARKLNVEEMMTHFSMVRLGLHLGLVNESISFDRLNELFVLCQPAHLQTLRNQTLEPDARDEIRADMIREKLFSTSLN